MTNAFLQTALLRAKSRSKNKKQNGFTLIELMIVVAIVGVLSAVGLPELTKAQDRAKVAAAKAQITNAGKECSLELISGIAGGEVDLSNFNLDAGKDTCGAGLQITADDSASTIVSLAWGAGDTTPGLLSDAPTPTGI